MTTARPRYPSDLTDRQWYDISHLFPGGDRPPGGRGRPRPYDLREAVNACLSLARGGCTWRMRPHDLPPWKTESDDSYPWRDDGTWEAVHAALRAEVRRAAGREPTPSAGVIDSRSVKATGGGRPEGVRRGEQRWPAASGTCRLTPRG